MRREQWIIPANLLTFTGGNNICHIRGRGGGGWGGHGVCGERWWKKRRCDEISPVGFVAPRRRPRIVQTCFLSLLFLSSLRSCVILKIRLRFIAAAAAAALLLLPSCYIIENVFSGYRIYYNIYSRKLLKGVYFSYLIKLRIRVASANYFYARSSYTRHL